MKFAKCIEWSEVILYQKYQCNMTMNGKTTINLTHSLQTRIPNKNESNQVAKNGSNKKKNMKKDINWC